MSLSRCLGLHANFRALMLLAPLYFVQCGESQKPGLVLRVADTHRELLADAQRAAYTADEMNLLFLTLDRKGAEYCSSLAKPDQRNQTFMREAAISHFGDDFQRRAQLAALGCQNWYLLREFDAFQTFSSVDALYPDDSNPVFTCISVGLMEPYLMAGVLNCGILYIVSDDFRILKAHGEILRRMRAGETTENQDLLSGLDLRFVTELDSDVDANARHVSIQQLCGDYYVDECRYYLNLFQANLKGFRSIQLYLGQLDAALSEISTEGYPLAVYLKDKVDPRYMTDAVFDRLIFNMAARGGAVAVYRRRGRDRFAVYRVEKNKKVRTVCADNFSQLAPARYSRDGKKYYRGGFRKYVNRFEEITQTTQSPPCSG